MSSTIRIERQQVRAICRKGELAKPVLITRLSLEDCGETNIDLAPEQVKLSAMEYRRWLIEQWERIDAGELSVLDDCMDSVGWDLLEQLSNGIYNVDVDGVLFEGATGIILSAPDEDDEPGYVDITAELLAACEYVVKYHGEHDSGEGELYGLDFVTTCINAIAKAKGA